MAWRLLVFQVLPLTFVVFVGLSLLHLVGWSANPLSVAAGVLIATSLAIPMWRETRSISIRGDSLSVDNRSVDLRHLDLASTWGASGWDSILGMRRVSELSGQTVKVSPRLYSSQDVEWLQAALGIDHDRPTARA
jgi:hypothetical protein